MNTNQIEGHASEAKEKGKDVAGKVIGDKTTGYRGKSGKHRAVLADINSDPETDVRTEGNKKDGKDGAVLGDINSDTEKEKKR